MTPEGGTWNYTYDTNTSCPSGYRGASGQLASVSDPNHNLLCYAYDASNRVIGVNANGTTCRHFYYDNSAGYSGSIPTGVTAPTNPYGRIVEAATDACSSSTLITDEWFSYDKDGRVTDQWESTPNSTKYYHSVATFYGNGAPNTVQLANPNEYTATWGLDGEGRLNTLQNSPSSHSIVSATTYNAASQPTEIDLGSTSDTDKDKYTYDPNTGQMKTWEFDVGTRSETAMLTWNPNQTLQELNITDGFTSANSQDCKFGDSSNAGYDDIGRLVRDDCGSGGWGQTFSYDQYDNLTKAVISGRTGITWNPGYSASTNQYALGGTSYDSNGNVTNDSFHAYGWNEFSKMASIDKSGTNCATAGKCLTYDAFGRVVEIASAGVYTQIWFTQAGKTAYMNGSTYNYAYWPTPGGGTLLNIATGNYYYMHKDWLGSALVTSTVPSTGTGNYIGEEAFAPYGEEYAVRGSSSGKEVWFTGDDSAILPGLLYDTPNRELAASNQGRWLSPDPAGVGWNQYAYPTNPNSEIDPSGLGPTCQINPTTGHCITGLSADPSTGCAMSLDGGGACAQLIGSGFDWMSTRVVSTVATYTPQTLTQWSVTTTTLDSDGNQIGEPTTLFGVSTQMGGWSLTTTTITDQIYSGSSSWSLFPANNGNWFQRGLNYLKTHPVFISVNEILAAQITYQASTGTICANVGAGASVPPTKAVTVGVLNEGDMGKWTDVQSSWGYSFGANLFLGYQGSFNSSGKIGGPTVSGVGLSGSYTYGGCTTVP